EVVGVRRLRADDLVAKHVPVDLDLVPRHDGPLRVAEQARMDEGEVAEVGEVLDLPRGVTAPLERAAEHRSPLLRLELGNLGERPARVVESDPHQLEALLARERGRTRLGWNAGRILELRDQRARAVGPVVPAVVGADDLVVLNGPERERRAAVDAEVGEGAGGSGGVAPEDERLVQEARRERAVLEVAREGDWVPTAAKRGLEPDRGG